mmetsp:Transcript_118563/g.215636  ORF Transcript_118563/g.215636 Transcript_118563/m.215636 type:complete len:170 (+) Transcript_118563:90-599(+)
MQKVALVLTCMACIAHGQREQTAAEPSETLAQLLLALNPEAAFNPSGTPMLANSRLAAANRISSRAPVMADEDKKEDEPEEDVKGFPTIDDALDLSYEELQKEIFLQRKELFMMYKNVKVRQSVKPHLFKMQKHRISQLMYLLGKKEAPEGYQGVSLADFPAEPATAEK